MTLQGGGRKLVNVGNYRLSGKRLGKGNFARVEEAVHTGLNYKVAVKVMDVTAIKEEYVVKNLYREARILSKLCHPCIVTLFQTMQYGNIYYIVTELVDGSDLCGFIKGQRHGKLDERYTRVYARQLISAISHMHSIGIVHRDLKMENVMLNSFHTQIKIVDFGLSNVYSDESPLRTHCGSPEYAAPELFVAGKLYGPEVDVWSLGVILYGMVVGQLPFVNSHDEHVTSQDRRKKLLAQINLGMAGPQRKAITFLSPEFKSMMNKLLIADSSKRITTKELIFHPWVTEKGKKAIRTNPYKRLDEHVQNQIINEISRLVDSEPEIIKCSIANEPQGNTAGIYNIIAYNHISKQHNTDCTTKTVTSQSQAGTKQRSGSAKLKISDSKSTLTKRNVPLKSAPVKKIENPLPSKIPTSATPIQASSKTIRSPKRDSLMTPRINTNDHKKLKRTSLSADVRQVTKRTSSTVQHALNKNSKQNVIKSSSTPRPLTSRIKQSPKTFTIQSPLRVEVSNSSNQNTSEIVCNNSSIATPRINKNELHVIGNRGVSKALRNSPYNEKIKTPTSKSEIDNKSAVSSNTPKTSERLIPSGSLEKGRCKSEPTNARRTYTGPIHTAERAMKRKSLLPVTTSQSTPSKSTNNTPVQVAQTPYMLRNRRILSSKVPVNIEKSPFGTGDAAKRPITTPANKMQQIRKPFLNEPIARSIAGYVVNNMPSSKLQAFKWVQSSKDQAGGGKK